MTPDMALIIIWAAFLAVGCAAALCIFLWGVRSGQFGDQERARSLPLEAEISGVDEPADGTEEEHG